ncbi:MAG TPA: hypothetical protein DFS52_13615 [Myxococcales bacterium]|jgi:hypothetical protein|nr:hypothetical protein [Myxococcales bacterium]
MRTHLYMLALSLPLTALVGCASESSGTLPPADGFHYPVSLSVLESAGGGPNVLYVVSSNFDWRYSHGSVIAVDLDKLDLDTPAPGGSTATRSIAAAVNPDTGHVFIDSFGGLMSAYQPAGALPASRTLFVPTRAEHRLFAIRAEGTSLSCFDAGEARDCSPQGIALANGDMTAEDPFATMLRGRELFVTHLRRPTIDDELRNSYLVKLDAEAPTNAPVFFDIGAAPAEGAVDTPRGVYLTGRAARDAAGDQSKALRVLVGSSVVDAGLTDETRVKETRGIGVSSDGARLFVSTRGSRSLHVTPTEGPDGLLVVDISADPSTGAARNEAVSFVPMPEGASRLLVLPRPGRKDLVAIACTDSDAVALYDDELGAIVNLVEGVAKPYDLAVASRAAGGQRLFVASFAGHTVDYIDIPDLGRPGDATLAGRLGATDSPPAASALCSEENP